MLPIETIYIGRAVAEACLIGELEPELLLVATTPLAPTYVDGWIIETQELWMDDSGVVWSSAEL